MPTRRSLLTAAIGTAGAGMFTGAALTPLISQTARAEASETGASGAGASGAATATAVEPFQVAMPVPPVLRPVSTAGRTDTYIVTMRPARKEILPGRLTNVLTYNGGFPGPTIKARSGRRVVVYQRNTLDAATAVHLHGADVTPENDGGPMDLIAPGAYRRYIYPNEQPHANLWFHDHAHHSESEHVYRGLSSSYLLTDATEQSLPLPSGRYDIPVALRDARFDEDGQLVYVMDDWAGRTTILANGKPWPYFQVAARKYRFRFLNSSIARFFDLRLADRSPMIQIGSDGGLLERPHTTDSLILTPGERGDVVIDFSRYRVGTQVVLENTLLEGGPEQVGRIMRFDVVRRASDRSSVPAELRSLPPVSADVGPGVVQRDIELIMDEGGQTHHPQAYINGATFDPDRIDTTIAHGSTELWTVTNTNQFIPHNFHMHLVQFRVVERNGAPVGPDEAGLKDTVRLMAGETVKLLATFNTHRGTYVYHCHMLDHSAMGMMAQMRIV
jgi:FtsP/CotA-like multicopper oxidase with cupredoxin domain